MVVFALALLGVVGTSALLTIALAAAWARFGRAPHAALWAGAFLLITLDHSLMVVRTLGGKENVTITLIATIASLCGATLIAFGFRLRSDIRQHGRLLVLAVTTIAVSAGLILAFPVTPVHHPLVSGYAALMLIIALNALRRGHRTGLAAGSVTFVMMRCFAGFFVLLTLLGFATRPLGPLGPEIYQGVYLIGVPTSLTGIGLFALVLLAEDLSHRLHQLATVDPLTGVLNRRGLEEAAKPLIARCARLAIPLCLAVTDLDHFKAVNDRYGHKAGDEALRRFARRIIRNLRTGDLVARTGGEEFVLVLPSTETDDALALIERLRSVPPEDQELGYSFPTASFGVAVLAWGDTLQTLVEKADTALYRAKEAGRDRVCLSEHASPLRARAREMTPARVGQQGP